MTDTTEFLPEEPPKWTPGQRTRNERMSAFLRALGREGSIARACETTSVDESTVWRWRDRHPTFGEAVNTFMTRTRQQRIEESMFRIATSTDPKQANAAVRAGELMLRALDRTQYGQHLEVKSTQTVNHMVQVVHTVRDDLRARQLARLSQLKTIDALPLSETDNTEQGGSQ
ncbi:hypothetical protein [Deinococcus sp. QL22]|uniref:hypothetical protein n=1 Tax=Deinococcus sp. QL22 TaxID=2939437 RepID=UPI002016E684|nr:hypothetical protein [Deinococcus sp. QL22]UQN10841.1 hypothetical protein M1R55_31610 [Deinococcus sp. QL22]